MATVTVFELTVTARDVYAAAPATRYSGTYHSEFPGVPSVDTVPDGVVTVTVETDGLPCTGSKADAGTVKVTLFADEAVILASTPSTVTAVAPATELPVSVLESPPPADAKSTSIDVRAPGTIPITLQFVPSLTTRIQAYGPVSTTAACPSIVCAEVVVIVVA